MRTPGLPARCPSWCVDQHEQAFEEGCGLEDSARHGSWGYTLRAGDGAVDTCINAEHRPETNHWGRPMIRTEVSTHDGERIRSMSVDLTSGDARVLARQLLELADKIDLE